MLGLVWEHPYRGDMWRLEVVEHHEKTFANLRRWYDTGEGEWRPTKHGFTIPLNDLWELTGALMAHHGLDAPKRPDTAA